jgi:hypothetical protein
LDNAGTHLAEGEQTAPGRHRHPFQIDDRHPRWPD